jgi:hypothetical protein
MIYNMLTMNTCGNEVFDGYKWYCAGGRFIKSYEVI